MEKQTEHRESSFRLVYILMVPLVTVVLTKSMFTVALPAIRNAFSLPADTTAWMITIYSLAFIAFTPLSGRLGDIIEKKKVLLIGLVLFTAGTVIALFCKSVTILVAARILQGMGTAAVNPLSLAIINTRFPAESRGKALGTWNSIGPICFMLGPIFSGLLIDSFQWSTIFLPILFFSVAALVTVVVVLPPNQTKKAEVSGAGSFTGSLQQFDWLGVLFLAGTTVAFVIYLSSRPITGVPPFRDIRLLIPALGLLGLFIRREKRFANPFVPLRLFGYRNFTTASILAGVRMISMAGGNVAVPLMIAEYHGLSASGLGLSFMIIAASVFSTMRLGGILSDRWDNRKPIIIGASIQSLTMLFLGFAGSHYALLIIGMAGHGLGAGLSIAAIHRNALDHVPGPETGLAAGLYTTIRFAGATIGSALAGVILQAGLDRAPEAPSAYLVLFFVLAAFNAAGALLATTLHS